MRQKNRERAKTRPNHAPIDGEARAVGMNSASPSFDPSGTGIGLPSSGDRTREGAYGTAFQGLKCLWAKVTRGEYIRWPLGILTSARGGLDRRRLNARVRRLRGVV